MFLLFVHTSSATTPACEGGAVIDLNLHSVVTLSQYAEEVHVALEGSVAKLDRDYAPAGFSSEEKTFTVQAFLDSKALARTALEKGGYLRVINGMFLESEGGFQEECLLTYEAAPVEVMVAQQRLAEAQKKAAMTSLMVCDPDGSREHSIKAPPPAGRIKVPIGQAAQGDGVMSILVESTDYKSIASQAVTIQGGRFTSASEDSLGIFCQASSFEDLCVNTEVAFAQTGGQPFRISTEVDWYGMSLSGCTVSR